MTLKEMVQTTLVYQGYDGLYNLDAECGCEFYDLAPCGRPGLACQGGVKAPCECGDHDFHIVPRAEKKP